jgi:hypothetical protein
MQCQRVLFGIAITTAFYTSNSKVCGCSGLLIVIIGPTFTSIFKNISFTHVYDQAMSINKLNEDCILCDLIVIAKLNIKKRTQIAIKYDHIQRENGGREWKETKKRKSLES